MSSSVKKLIFSVIIIFSGVLLYSQEIHIDVSSEPLNKVLVDLRDSYKLKVSFNDEQLSAYVLTLSGDFRSPGDAISALIKGLPLAMELNGDVYVIYPVIITRTPVKYKLSGNIVDAQSYEALPYSHILIDGHGYVTDFKGNFSYSVVDDSVFNVRVSYLGYFVLDTVLQAGRAHSILLKASSIDLEEIVVTGNVIERSVQSGSSPGEMRINHKVAGYLPGNGDNSVFNLLRLQPGILASGEQSGNLIIWGSYEGHSKVVFDGYTIFGLKNFNDNISAVNPYLAKDIKVLKGGFGTEYGQRVGGIVDITGIDGNTADPNVNLSINNMTLNGMASVPVLKKSALVFAFRQTYYDLYDAVNLNFLSSRNSNRNSNVDLNVYPDYLFRDMNFKYSGRLSNGDNYFLSLYSGSDNFSYEAEQDDLNRTISNNVEESNYQKGMSAFYGKKWRNGFVTNITLAQSGLINNYADLREVIRHRPGMRPDTTIFSREINSRTDISEMEARMDNYFPVSGSHTLKFGFGIINDDLRYREDTFSVTRVENNTDIILTNAYLSDRISLTQGFTIEPGLRIDYSPTLKKVYLQPRISAGIDMGERFRFNAAVGRYKQFIAMSPVVDEGGNYRFLWTVCDETTIPVLSAEHYVAGLSYSYSDLIVSIEAYLKNTDGLTKYLKIGDVIRQYYGDSRSRGIDLFIKNHFGRHTAWLSYSLSKTEEFFPFTEFSDYRLALHDQRHEVKAAAIINFYPFYISGNYVYGSGFADPTPNIEGDYTQTPYNRLDLSVVYKFERKKYVFDAGLSVLNVFNTENIKYENFVRIPAELENPINLHAEAVPRTLTVFLNLSF